MTKTIATPEAAADALKETETRVHDVAGRFTQLRDALTDLSKEGDRRVLGSSAHIAKKAKLEKQVQDLAVELEEAREALTQARSFHQEALEGHYEAILPEILDQRHRLAVEADEHISALNETLTEIMELNGKEFTARKLAGRGGADTLRADKIIAGWVAAHLPALRTMRSSGIFVYSLCRRDLSAIYSKHEEKQE